MSPFCVCLKSSQSRVMPAEQELPKKAIDLADWLMDTDKASKSFFDPMRHTDLWRWHHSTLSDAQFRAEMCRDEQLF